jgi:hypothetical protein
MRRLRSSGSLRLVADIGCPREGSHNVLPRQRGLNLARRLRETGSRTDPEWDISTQLGRKAGAANYAVPWLFRRSNRLNARIAPGATNAGTAAAPARMYTVAGCGPVETENATALPANAISHALPAQKRNRNPLRRTSLGGGGGFRMRPIARNDQLATLCQRSTPIIREKNAIRSPAGENCICAPNFVFVGLSSYFRFWPVAVTTVRQLKTLVQSRAPFGHPQQNGPRGAVRIFRIGSWGTLWHSQATRGKSAISLTDYRGLHGSITSISASSSP